MVGSWWDVSDYDYGYIVDVEENMNEDRKKGRTDLCGKFNL